MLKDRPHDADRPLTALDLRPLCTAALLGTPWPRTSRLGLVHHALSSYITPWPRTSRLGLVHHALASRTLRLPCLARLVLVHQQQPCPRTSTARAAFDGSAWYGTHLPIAPPAATSTRKSEQVENAPIGRFSVEL